MKKPGRPGSGGPTLRAIAERTGHGLMTVSRALSADPSRVAPDKRAEIQRMAAEMGYRPNLNVHALRRGSGNLVGLLCRRLDGRTHEILIGLHDVLVGQDLLPFLLMTEHHPARDGLEPGMAALRHLVERRCAAIIAVVDDPDAPAAWLDGLPQEAGERGIPSVVIGPRPTTTATPILCADLAGAAQAMVAHARGLGVRQAVILGDAAGDPWHGAIAAAITAAAGPGLAVRTEADPAWRPDGSTAVFATSQGAITRLLGHPGLQAAWIAGADAQYLPIPGLVIDLDYRGLGAAAATLVMDPRAGQADQPLPLIRCQTRRQT